MPRCVAPLVIVSSSRAVKSSDLTGTLTCEEVCREVCQVQVCDLFSNKELGAYEVVPPSPYCRPPETAPCVSAVDTESL